MILKRASNDMMKSSSFIGVSRAKLNRRQPFWIPANVYSYKDSIFTKFEARKNTVTRMVLDAAFAAAAPVPRASGYPNLAKHHRVIASRAMACWKIRSIRWTGGCG
jgi:hypothetical protein